MFNNIKSGIKNGVITLLELAQVRIEMVRIEINEQKNQLILVLFLVFLMFVFLLVSFVVLLFWLDNYLLPDQKNIVFCSIFVVCFLFAVFSIIGILKLLKKQRDFMKSTLEEIRLDIKTFKNILTFKQNGER